MAWVVLGGQNFGAVDVNGKVRVIKPERNFIHDVLTAVAGFDRNGEPYPCSIYTTGGDFGAPRVAEAWAEQNMMGLKRFPLKPKTWGKKAPQKRLEALLDAKPTHAIVFPLDKRDAPERALARDLETARVPVFYAEY